MAAMVRGAGPFMVPVARAARMVGALGVVGGCPAPARGPQPPARAIGGRAVRVAAASVPGAGRRSRRGAGDGAPARGPGEPASRLLGHTTRARGRDPRRHWQAPAGPTKARRSPFQFNLTRPRRLAVEPAHGGVSVEAVLYTIGMTIRSVVELKSRSLYCTSGLRSGGVRHAHMGSLSGIEANDRTVA
jgi:hypothetical protein